MDNQKVLCYDIKDVEMEGIALYGFVETHEGKLKKDRVFILRHRISFFQDPDKQIIHSFYK